jgi:hypothetical protein
MKNYKRTLFLATALSMISTSLVQAGKLTVINNHPEQRIQLCIRGESPKERDRKDCFGPTVEAGTQTTYIVEKKKHVGGSNTFEVTASTGNGGNPDWKLLGGTCSQLFTESDHIVLIEANALGKLSCRNITAENPPATQ